ncbi:site-2 protease family protein [Candidatus Parcubacteria bacterium]|nr:MAG: site-2 protease family protein [Candidatus Parcubacteria bacterium]
MEIQLQIFFLLVILLSAVIHEYSHGYMAWQLGDDTAKVMGRLTINPLAHIDPFGTILLPLVLWFVTGGSFIFAYAKPVPVNLYRLQNQKWGPPLVAFAGPGSNLVTAGLLSLILRFLPISPFAGFLAIVIYANLLLAVFNLVPIPPLDGSRILDAIVPDKFMQFKLIFQQYGFVLLLFFIFFLFPLIVPVISFLFYLLTGYNFWHLLSFI